MMVHCVIRDLLQYVLVHDYGMQKFKKVKQLHYKIKIRSTL